MFNWRRKCFYNNVVICHDVCINSFNYFSPSSTVLGTAKIKYGCFIGANATIKNGIIIDDYSLIGANSFVRKNTCKESVVVPAKSVVLDCNSLFLVEKLM